MRHSDGLHVDEAPPAWSGRDDGPGPEHARWHTAIRPYEWGADAVAGTAGETGTASTSTASTGTVLIGFASEAGVIRNQGRPGQVAGPDALRAALGPLALAGELDAQDAGTIRVAGDALEDGQQRLGGALATLIDRGHLPIALGGGHEIAYGSYLGIADSALRQARPRLGVLNLDAHFDLRDAPRASSGTPFRQLLEREQELGRPVEYAVIGISETANTQALFTTAAEHGVRFVLDDDAQGDAASLATVDAFVDGMLERVDLVYLTIDLDVLPASVAPGVSAPSSLGVPLPVIQRVCDRIAASSLLALADVAELNPALDIDRRTARAAARLIHRIATRHVPVDRHGASA